MVSAPRFIALVLIVLGAIGLLSNLGLMDLNLSQIIRTYWPTILIVAGIRSFLPGRRRGYWHEHHHSPIRNVLLIGMGVFLLAVNVGWVEISVRSAWSVIWPLLLIWIGVEALFVGHRAIVVTRDSDGFTVPAVRSKDGSMHTVSAFIGELRVGGRPFELKDTRYDIRLGDVQIDLTQALIPDREVNLEIIGLAGDVDVYVPHDLPVKVEARVMFGDIRVLGEHAGTGVGSPLHYQTPGYDEAIRKLNLVIHLKAGDINVQRV